MDILARASGKSGADMYPTVTSYRDRNLLQVQGDIFIVAMGGYCIMTSTGELARRAVDAAVDQAVSMAGDKNYSAHRAGNGPHEQLSLFLTGRALASAAGNIVAASRIKGELYRGADEPKDDGADSRPRAGDNHGDAVAAGDALFQSVNYASAGLSFENKRLTLAVSADFNRTDASINGLIDSLRPGSLGDARFCADSNTYVAFAADLVGLTASCRNGSGLCGLLAISLHASPSYRLDFAADIAAVSAGTCRFSWAATRFPRSTAASVCLFP